MAHALAARRLASRIAAVREAVGLAAYAAGEWQTAIAELRTYHRMSGKQTHLAVLADCERALGRPERAVDIYRAADKTGLEPAEAIELLIVAAGARGDMGQKDAAAAMLQVRELAGEADEPWAGRLRYAYADALLAVGRREEAREWFARASEADPEGATDAAERLLDLDGVVMSGDEKTDLEEDEFTAGEGDAGGDKSAEASRGGDAEGDDEDEVDDPEDAFDGDDESDESDDEDEDGGPEGAFEGDDESDDDEDGDELDGGPEGAFDEDDEDDESDESDGDEDDRGAAREPGAILDEADEDDEDGDGSVDEDEGDEAPAAEATGGAETAGEAKATGEDSDDKVDGDGGPRA